MQEQNFQQALEVERLARRQAEALLEEKVREMDFARVLLEKNYADLQRAHEELKSAQSQLVQNSKMTSLGQLAAGIAHEINNPIAFIKSNIEVLHRYIQLFLTFYERNQSLYMVMDKADNMGAGCAQKRKEIADWEKEIDINYAVDDIGGLVCESLEGVGRVAEIVSGLKSFSHLDEAEYKMADVNQSIELALKMVWNEIKYRCTVHKNLEALPFTKCYPGQLNQVFTNLIVNAVQAIDKQGEITIHSYCQNQEIIVSISDTGCGIPQEIIDKLFDPFFTTKGVSGTGLGLSISYGIVKKHGGKISVDSTVGKGTTFTVSFPVAE